MAKGFIPEQLIAVNPHRSSGRRVIAAKGATWIEAAEIVAALCMAVPLALIAAHIISGWL